MHCPFCKIVAGELPSKNVFQDELVTAFHDLNPAAALHILIVPNRHISSVNDLTEEDERLMGHLFTAAKKIAAQVGVDKSGYRLIANTNEHAGQTVFHLHLHLLGGAPLKGLGR